MQQKNDQNVDCPTQTESKYQFRQFPYTTRARSVRKLNYAVDTTKEHSSFQVTIKAGQDTAVFNFGMNKQ